MTADIIDTPNEQTIDKTIACDNNNETIVCYSLMALRYDAENFEHYFERSLEEIAEKSDIHIEILNASLTLANALYPYGNEWTLCDKNFCCIVVQKQTYQNTTFTYAKQCYSNFAKQHLTMD